MGVGSNPTSGNTFPFIGMIGVSNFDTNKVHLKNSTFKEFVVKKYIYRFKGVSSNELQN